MNIPRPRSRYSPWTHQTPTQGDRLPRLIASRQICKSKIYDANNKIATNNLLYCPCRGLTRLKGTASIIRMGTRSTRLNLHCSSATSLELFEPSNSDKGSVASPSISSTSSDSGSRNICVSKRLILKSVCPGSPSIWRTFSSSR